MHKTIGFALSLLLALPGTGLTGDKILEFHTMTPVVRPFNGTTNPVRGVNGGGIPWMLTKGMGQLGFDGRVQVRVQGLVLAEGTGAGTNPIPQFKAIVSCLTPTTDQTGNLVVATVNRSTNTFPASPDGDAIIDDVVSLPSPCIAPIVFVTSPTGSWFAATGS
ncbi:MAG: hypothetical protein ACM3SQ_02230 [Betaproteobacteria bacterium]